MFMIMLMSSIGTLILLPAIITGIKKLIFEEEGKGLSCNCINCVIAALAVSLTVIAILAGAGAMKWTELTGIALVIVLIMAGGCNLLSKRRVCAADKNDLT